MADPVEFELMEWTSRLPDDKRADATLAYMRQKKDRTTALVLGLLVFLGFPGIGRLYVGDVALGLLMFFLGWFTCGLWPLIDLFFITGAADRANRDVLYRLRTVIR